MKGIEGYRQRRLAEQEFGFDIPEKLGGIYCYSCFKKVNGKFRGVSENSNGLKIIHYDCVICGDTTLIRPEELKEKLPRLIA